jgi:hypothetical protein
MQLKGETIRVAAVGDISLLQQPGPELYRASWDKADLRIANLEGPLITEPGPPAEKLIRLRLPAEAADWLRDLDTTAVSLANNHTMDWGPEGLYTTIGELDRVGIGYCGAGADAAEAEQPTIIAAGGYKIAFLSWAATIPPGFRATRHRPGIAGIRIRSSYLVDASIIDEQPGTPPWVVTEPIAEDLERLEAVVQQAAAAADFVILALHWGIPPQWASAFQGVVAQYQPLIARRAVAAGAGIIVGHHCHAPYGLGALNDVPILYSLGNYIFHPEYLEGELDFSPVTVPYQARHLPENEQSCIAVFELAPTRGGRLRVEKLALEPAVLNELGEAVAPARGRAKEIAVRLAAFSQEQKAVVAVENGKVRWRSGR